MLQDIFECFQFQSILMMKPETAHDFEEFTLKALEFAVENAIRIQKACTRSDVVSKLLNGFN